MSKRLINVYEDEFRDNIVARVQYNENLDYWDGRDWTNGGRGIHKGITKLRDGRFVIIIGSQWWGSTDYAYIISKEEALQEILKSGNTELLNSKRFAELKVMLDELNDAEEIDGE